MRETNAAANTLLQVEVRRVIADRFDADRLVPAAASGLALGDVGVDRGVLFKHGVEHYPAEGLF